MNIRSKRQLMTCTPVVALLAVTGILGSVHCDNSKPTQTTAAPPQPKVYIEDSTDHSRLYEYRDSPNGERIRHGKFLIKSLDDKVLATGFYADDKETGIWRVFYPDGKLKIEGEWLYGEKNGEWRYFDAAGNLEKKELYVNGKLAVPIDDVTPEADAQTKGSTNRPAASQPAPTP